MSDTSTDNDDYKYRNLYGATPPITAERAIEVSLGIDDHYARDEFLRGWQEGNWDLVSEFCDFKLDTDTVYKAVDFIETYTGMAFYPLKPEVSKITVIDIAHHLAHQNRYSGATEFFYSTAQHCCLLYDYVIGPMGGTALDGLQVLLHDGAEYALVDMPRPVKQHMPEFRVWDRKIQMCIRSWAGLGDLPIPSWQDELDSRIIMDERAQVMSDSGNDWGMNHVEPLGITIKPWLPYVAEQQFLMRYAACSYKVFGAHQYLRSAWGIPTDSFYMPFRTGGGDVAQSGDFDPKLITDLFEVDLRGGVGRVALRSPNGMMIRDTNAGRFPRPAYKWIRGNFMLSTPELNGVSLDTTEPKK
jgi:uncharacterized protein